LAENQEREREMKFRGIYRTWSCIKCEFSGRQRHEGAIYDVIFSSRDAARKLYNITQQPKTRALCSRWLDFGEIYARCARMRTNFNFNFQIGILSASSGLHLIIN
jgi:hypothetical protein